MNARRDYIKRYYSNQQVEKAVKVINEFKDKIAPPQYDIILDNPWETEEDLIETLMFLVKFPTPYILSLFSLTFYPETELYRKARKDGIITDELRDVYRKHCHARKKTYLNRLFFLLKRYASSGIRISPKIMSLLTNRKLRQFKLNWLLYVIIYIISEIWFRMRRLEYLLHEGLKDIRKGDWFRIIKYIKKI